VSAVAVKPRLGFLGAGWIGRNRLDAVADAGAGEVVAVADPALPDCLNSLEELLERGVDGVVIATPSALHAEQAIEALEAGVAVFCQKPLARTADEARAVVDAARRNDRLLAVDVSYRFTRAVTALRGTLPHIGDVRAVELVFHNGYGPDKPWFYDRRRAGGGCVIDLGTHLLDLALWLLDWPVVERVDARTLHRGGHEVEDYADVRLDLADGTIVSLACSWNLPIGRDCDLRAAFYGRDGGVAFRNVDGSFYDFRAERYSGTATETLAEPPDGWGGRAICAWADRLARGEGYDPEVERVVDVAAVIDRVYGRTG
jgi:predicted dehydrogenase